MEEAIYKPCTVHLNTSTSYAPSKWDLHLYTYNNVHTFDNYFSWMAYITDLGHGMALWLLLHFSLCAMCCR